MLIFRIAKRTAIPKFGKGWPSSIWKRYRLSEYKMSFHNPIKKKVRYSELGKWVDIAKPDTIFSVSNSQKRVRSEFVFNEIIKLFEANNLWLDQVFIWDWLSIGGYSKYSNDSKFAIKLRPGNLFKISRPCWALTFWIIRGIIITVRVPTIYNVLKHQSGEFWCSCEVKLTRFLIRRATSVPLGKDTYFALHHWKRSTTKRSAIQILHISTFQFVFKCECIDFISNA